MKYNLIKAYKCHSVKHKGMSMDIGDQIWISKNDINEQYKEAAQYHSVMACACKVIVAEEENEV